MVNVLEPADHGTAGAAIFGIGWGLAGYCPGPAMAGLAIGNRETLWFVCAIPVGSALYGWSVTETLPL